MMMTAFRGWSLGCVLSGVFLSALPAQAQELTGVVRLGGTGTAGTVRISDRVQPVEYRSQSPDTVTTDGITADMVSTEDPELAQAACEVEPETAPGTVTCPPGEIIESNAHCHPGLPWSIASWIHNDLARKGAWFNGKCGQGHCRHEGPERPLAGCYHMVYAVDPGYFDRRDGQVYAAPGYGGPVSVPLAPVVNHTYNYGWGIPSSRMTPVLHPATQAPVSQLPHPYPSAPISY